MPKRATGVGRFHRFFKALQGGANAQADLTIPAPGAGRCIHLTAWQIQPWGTPSAGGDATIVGTGQDTVKFRVPIGAFDWNKTGLDVRYDANSAVVISCPALGAGVAAYMWAEYYIEEAGDSYDV